MKEDVLTLAQDLSLQQGDPATASALYDEAVLALHGRPLLVGMTFLEHDAENSVYDVPDAALELLAVFYDDRQLSSMTRQAIESIQPDWRDRRGPPRAFVTETEGDRRFRLWPVPDTASTPESFVFGEPFGRDYPGYILVVLATEARRDVPAWLELPLALEVLGREFARESNHRDPVFAGACAELAVLLLEAVS